MKKLLCSGKFNLLYINYHSNVRRFRYKNMPYFSQRMLAEHLSQKGIELSKNVIQRIESGQRFVTDIELTAMAKVFGVTVDELIQQ